MKFDAVTITLVLLSSTLSLAAPQPVTGIQTRDVAAVLDVRNVDISDLWKRKGGGGGGARGGGGSSSSSSSGYVPSSNTGSVPSSNRGSGASPYTGTGGAPYTGSGTPYTGSRGGGSSWWNNDDHPAYGGSGGWFTGSGSITPWIPYQPRPRPVPPVVVVPVGYQDNPGGSYHAGGSSSRVSKSSGLRVQGVKLESVYW